VLRPTLILAALPFSIAFAVPAAAQQASPAPPHFVRDPCLGCFAYLEFPASEAQAHVTGTIHAEPGPPYEVGQDTKAAAQLAHAAAVED
jgi:hypothetical protein